MSIFSAYQTYRARRLLNQMDKNHAVKGVVHTRDAPDIEVADKHLILIYNQMMLERPLHHLIEPFVEAYAGPAFSNEPTNAFVHNDTNEPIVFPVDTCLPEWAIPPEGSSPNICVKGDLFEVSRKSVYEIDKLMLNHVKYQRTRITTQAWQRKEYYSEQFSRTHTSPQTPRFQSTWTYYGVPEFWCVDSGYEWRPMRFYQSRNVNKPHFYYFFNPQTDRRPQSQK